MSEMSLTFFRVTTDPDRFQFLLTDREDEYRFDGRRYGDRWVPPPVYSYKPRLKESDFWDFGMGVCGVAWAVRPEAFEKAPELRPVLQAAGELLPLPFDGREFELFNVTECIDALDKGSTTWDYYDDGSLADVADPVFRIDRLGANVFKVPEDSSMRIYLWEDDAWHEHLRGLVERYRLTGLVFTRLYTTSST
ncbi:MAG: hypothetical protein ACRDQT_11235 [Gaiellaceae bacterium]